MVSQQVKKRTQVTETADSLLILTSTFSQFVLMETHAKNRK